jgi:hypothetical protein
MHVLQDINKSGFAYREVQTLRQEVRESPAVRFVVSVYSALNSHNFVRFFRFVKQAPFLMASILHRYFGQMRTHALIVITRAYNERVSPILVNSRRTLAISLLLNLDTSTNPFTIFCFLTDPIIQACGYPGI